MRSISISFLELMKKTDIALVASHQWILQKSAVAGQRSLIIPPLRQSNFIVVFHTKGDKENDECSNYKY